LGNANATALRTHCASAGDEPSVDTETTTSPSRLRGEKEVRAPGVVDHVEQDIALRASWTTRSLTAPSPVADTTKESAVEVPGW